MPVSTRSSTGRPALRRAAPRSVVGDGSLSGSVNSSVSMMPGYTTWILHVGVAQVDLHALGPRRDRGLRRRVRGLTGRRQARRDRRHEHDAAGARDELGEQREREADRREVVDRHHGFDGRRRRARDTCGASGCRRCSRARRCRRARRTPAARTPRAPSRSARSTVHARESGACSRHRASTVVELVGPARADADGRAPPREPLAEPGADARRRAGHEHVLAVQVVRHGREASLGRHVAHAGVGAAHRPASRSSPAPRRGSARRSRPRTPASAPTSRICDRDADGLARTAAADRSGRSRTRPPALLDVRDGDAVRSWIEPLDAVDVLVNNAGGGFYAAFLDVNDKGQDALIRENFTSVTTLHPRVRPEDARRAADRSSTSRRSRRTVRRPASRSTPR